MKHWLNTHYKTLIIAAFLIPILTVAVVSISHVTQWYGISNPVSWAVYLSIGIEIAALSALAAISANMGSKVYFPFAIVTIIQFIGNIFFAYSYIDINAKHFRDWVDLVSPLVEFMGVDPNDFVGHKRFLAFFAGGMLPIISLSFLHMLVKFTEEDRKKEEKVILEEEKHLIDDHIIQEAIEKYKKEQESSNPEDLKNFVDESARIRLSEDDLKKLEEVLLNPPPPNEELKAAAEKYNDEPLDEMMYSEDEKRMDIIGQNGNEGLHYEEEDVTPANYISKEDTQIVLRKLVEQPPYVSDDFTIGPDGAFEMTEEIEEELQKDNVSDWDVTLMDGLEDEEPFFTEEEIEKILQEEPTEEEIQGNFSTIEPNTENIFQEEDYVPSLSDEEIMNMNQDEYERNLDMEDEFDGFVPEPFATPEEVEEFEIDETPVQSEPEVEKKNP